VGDHPQSGDAEMTSVVFGEVMEFEESMEHVVQAFEVVGVAILAVGSVIALCGAAVTATRRSRLEAYEQARHDIGRAILLGLEVLIIADIVQTITIHPTLESALTLGLIVLVRTFLSFSLEIELEGVVPWHQRRDRDKSEVTAVP
jgi:uncharacterized membrane protein